MPCKTSNNNALEKARTYMMYGMLAIALGSLILQLLMFLHMIGVVR